MTILTVLAMLIVIRQDQHRKFISAVSSVFLDLFRITANAHLNSLRISLLTPFLQLSFESIIACLVRLMIPLLLMMLDHAMVVELERHLGIQRLFGRLLSLEDVVLR